MESNYRKKLIRLLTFLGGVYFFFEFVLPEAALEGIGLADRHTEISNGFRAFGAMAVGLGIVNLLLVHGSRVLMVRKNWSYSLILLGGLFSMMAVASLDWLQGERLTKTASVYSQLADFSAVIVRDHEEKKEGVLPLKERTSYLTTAAEAALIKLDPHLNTQNVNKEDTLLSRSYIEKISNSRMEAGSYITLLKGLEEFSVEPYDGVKKELSTIRSELQKLLFLKQKNALIKKLYEFLYQGLFVALGSAMFSLLAMYIAAAAYRAFRIKSFESALMMGAAVIVMLGQIPFYAYISSDLPFLRAWLLEVPNSAAFRAIKIGASIAGLVMAFRMWFSIESESFSHEEKA